MTGHETPYFELQADVGVTQHLGGLGATEELLDACHVDEGDLVLDVGCGTGTTPCYAARRYGCRVVGLDVSDRMLGWAARRARREGVADEVAFVVGDVHSLPFADGRFDAVLAESVTAFAEDKARAVDEYVRVTKPGGYVGVNETTWLADPPPELHEYVTRTVGAEFETPAGWTDRLEAAGLDGVEASIHEVNPFGQYGSELRRQGVVTVATAWWRTLAALATDPDFRRLVRRFRPGGWRLWRSVVGVFEYYGYGIYAGEKPS